MNQQLKIGDKVITSKGNKGVINRIEYSCQLPFSCYSKVDFDTDKKREEYIQTQGGYYETFETYYVTLGEKEFPIHPKHLRLIEEEEVWTRDIQSENESLRLLVNDIIEASINRGDTCFADWIKQRLEEDIY